MTTELTLFELATRKAIRFASLRGSLSIEDLWNLPLTTKTANGISLDLIAKTVHRELKDAEEESFVVKKSTANVELQIKFDIVKRIIDVKLAEAETRKEAAAKKEERERLMAVVDRKKAQQYDDLTLEEAQAKLDSL